MELEKHVQVPMAKRFVVEDSITKVTSDGEPHGMMTMVACLSGLLTATIILAILVSMVACRKRKINNKQALSVTYNNEDTKPAVAITSVSSVLAGNLNAAFMESTLSLADSCKQLKQQPEQLSSTCITLERY